MTDNYSKRGRGVLAGVTVVIAALGAVWFFSSDADENAAFAELGSINTPTTLPASPQGEDSVFDRPVGFEFFMVYTSHPDLLDWCDTHYPIDPAGCYDALDRDHSDFESVILAAYERVEGQWRRPEVGTRQWQDNQYGCHGDGRCLDDYGVWCAESDVVYHEGTGEEVCWSTYESLEEEAASDDWPHYEDDPGSWYSP